jgi:ankyrin repeat protein
LAANADDRKAAEALLASGADFYARDENGQLPLDLPPGGSMNDTRKWLREVNKSRNAFLTALHENQIDRVTELLAADRSLASTRDIGDGWSAVMSACHFGNLEMLRLLLDAGASLDAVDFNNGHDAVFVCAEKGQTECLRLLLAAGAKPDRMWRVNYGALPMQMNALHVAAWKGHGPIVQLLLDAKVDPNVRSKSYAMFSPLHFAATEGHTAIVRQLLDAGADTTARDGRRGITALEMARAATHTDAAAALGGK